MPKTISIHSFRGGTGKSNITANLSVLLASRGKRVGVIDTDIQSPGIHVIFAKGPGDFQYALNDFLWGKARIEQAAYDVTDAAFGNPNQYGPRTKLFLIPSSIDTGAIAKVIREGYDVALLNEGFQRLIQVLDLDYLLIDTHPGVNEETLLSIAISDVFLLILRPDNQDFQGTSVTVELARRLEVGELLVVLNKVPAKLHTEALAQRVQDAYQAPVVGMLPLSEEMAHLASSGLFVNRHPQHPLAQELQRIADRLAQ
ncbi:MAG: MinD/ParA family protein [Pirellulales bacterium]|nr:MinD/ParA family protein [Pirellulales bacterium]